MASRKNAVLLDVDPSILENNLLITDPDGGLDSLFPKESGPQSKVVNPIPGLCLKLRLASEDHGKVFINLCHTQDIPAPEDISDERLVELWNTTTGTCDYRVPLSIGERRAEPDKSGKPADVYDVAINTTFFGKIETNNIFRMFLIDVIMQGIEDKFHIELDKEDYVVMKNRRAMGTIPGHRVRVKDKKDGSKPATPLVQELGTRYLEPAVGGDAARRDLAAASDAVKPQFRLLKQVTGGVASSVVAQVHLPLLVSAGDITLDIGEDRLVLNGETRATKYHLDVFLPHCVLQKCATAQFDGVSKILSITMPVLQAA
ncbi:PIH1 domain-containing protein 1-like [Thrips palmi]|uniref:PIH1 domain-containing protein 1 n=1 Tax=Thrips palmi TaxID=161013 RepID=A0A6P9A7W5_THRPL|nr:PIH1 domain-containing protein 1-like [Thrips palmi]